LLPGLLISTLIPGLAGLLIPLLGWIVIGHIGSAIISLLPLAGAVSVIDDDLFFLCLFCFFLRISWLFLSFTIKIL